MGDGLTELGGVPIRDFAGVLAAGELLESILAAAGAVGAPATCTQPGDYSATFTYNGEGQPTRGSISSIIAHLTSTRISMHQTCSLR